MMVRELRDRLIADGIAEVTEVYADDPVKRDGAIEGFELCRSLDTIAEYDTVLSARSRREHEKRCNYYDETLSGTADKQKHMDDYWRHRWATLQVEWIRNCLLVVLGEPGTMLSGRAAMKVAGIIVVGSERT